MYENSPPRYDVTLKRTKHFGSAGRWLLHYSNLFGAFFDTYLNLDQLSHTILHIYIVIHPEHSIEKNYVYFILNGIFEIIFRISVEFPL